MEMDLMQNVEELLESEQRKAEARDSNKSANKPNGREDRYEKDGRDTDTRSRHNGDGDGDDHMKDSDDRHSANGSERSRRHGSGSVEGRNSSRKDRYRDGSRDRSHRDRGSDRYRRGGRDRSRSPVSDYYRPSGRRDDHHARDRRDHRRRSPGHRNHRDDPRDRRDRSRDREHGRDKSRDRDAKKGDSPRNAKQKSPQPTDEDCDRRTVFVQQLAARSRTRDLLDFFGAVGPVVEAQIVKDRVSGRSKGVGYVEFKDIESVDKAIALTGQKLLGIPVIVSLTEAEKNRQARNNTGQPTQSNGIPFHRLYVGNIHFSVDEEDITKVFEPFGELEFVQLQRDDTGRSKGYGFVQFVDPANAKTALQDMNGFEIANRPIRVGLGNDKFTPDTTANLLQRFPAGQNPNFQGSSFSGSGGRGSHAGGSANFERAGGREEKGAGGSSALDDSDVMGVNYHSFSRDSLMKKLARVPEPPGSSTNASTSRGGNKKPAAPSMAPSRCVIVKNAYNENEQTEPNWVKEFEEDFRDECSDKYGAVIFVALYRDSAEGEVYIKFQDLKGGENALKGLNGRFFDGRTLTAQPVVDAIFNMNFPKAANL